MMEISNLPSPLKVKESVLRIPNTISMIFHEKMKRDHESDAILELHDLKSIVEELLDHHSKKHLDVLKKITRNITAYSSSTLWPLLVEILINGLYYCHASHSIKSAVNSIIRQLSESDIDLVSSVIHEKLEISTQDEALAVNAVEFVAALLQSNFGCKVIVSHIYSILDFFSATLNHFLHEVQCSKPTTKIAQLYANVHSLSRTLLPILKLIQGNFSEEKNQQLLASITSVLNLKGIPLDAKGNCSKIFIILMKCRENGMSSIVAKITGTNPENLCKLSPLEDSLQIRLNLAVALLSSSKLEELLADQPPYGTVLGGVVLSVLLTSKNGLNETELALITARLLEQWQRKCFECFTSSNLKTSQLTTEWSAASDQLLEMSLNGLEHQIDVVRHTAKDAFLMSLKILILLKNDVDRIIQSILLMQRFKKSKYIALACLAKTELTHYLLQAEYKLAEELLDVAKEADLSSQAKEVFNLLMFHKVEKDKEWMERWLYPLLSAMENHPNAQSFESLLIDVLKLHPVIIHNVENWCQEERSSRLPVFITALLACRKFGLFPTDVSVGDGDLWNGVINTNVLELALEHEDGKLRLSALSVIVEGPKTSQLYSRTEIQWIQRFISTNMDNPNAAFRQQFCSCLKKFLVKLKNGGVPLIGRNQEIATSYRSFVSWLIDKCLTDLGPGSSFSRRFLSLHLLKLLQESVGLEINPAGLNTGSSLGLAAVLSLVDCFFDSYDVNKELALELLQSKPLLAAVQQDAKGDELVNFYWESSLALSQSLRSADTVAAGFFFRWLIHFTFPEPEFQEKTGHRLEWSQQTASTIYMINELLRMLKVQLDAVRGNLCRLAVDAPVYGLLSSIRLLLNHLISRTDELIDKSLTSVVLDVIEVCFEASAITSPVVTCDSPEGYLPDNSSLMGSGISAQALLVSGWRSVKEVAIFFGQISAWILGKDNRLIDDHLILKMGLHLKHLLLETKHRGAFEQVYCGFSQLSYALWRTSVREFNVLPATWLLDIVDDLKHSESAAKLCATRRSAGLPFIFQAVLSPEVELGRGELFAGTVESLLEIASGSESECRIHALNILRTLYRESRLNQVIGPYIARGLMLSIAGFEASDWPERNSSTLLFSALMTRIFGVPRSKSDFQKKNSLTGRVFFQLYPELYPFLLERLRSIVFGINSGGIHLHPSLFPMLVLLGRLHPPTCEFSDSAFKLEPFVPLVRECGSSPVLKTRQLAAQALTPLLTPTIYARMLPKVLDSIKKPTSHNTLHGILLQIHYFVKDVLKNTDTRRMIFETVKLIIQTLINLLCNNCYLIRYECAQILDILQTEEILDFSENQVILQICLKELETSKLNCDPFYPLSCQKLAALAMHNINSSNSLEIVKLLHHPFDEVKLEVLQQLDRIKSSTNIDGLSSALELIVSSENNSTDCQIIALRLFARHNQSNRGCLQWSLKIYREAKDDSIRCAALAAAGQTIQPTDNEDMQLLQEWSGYLLDALQGPFHFRQMVVESLASCSFMLQIDQNQKITKEHGCLLCSLWTCLLNCLIDDDESIRSAAASVVGDLYAGSCKQTQSTVSLEKALEYLVSQIGPLYPSEVVSVLSQLALDEEDEQLEGDSLAFEKGDSDAFREPLVHSILFCHFIELCLDRCSIISGNADRIIEQLENRWKMLTENCNGLNGDSLSSGLRYHIISSVQLFLLTRALQSAHQKIASLHQCIRLHLEKLSPHWKIYSIQKVVLSG